jgi:hypothetical protein
MEYSIITTGKIQRTLRKSFTHSFSYSAVPAPLKMVNERSITKKWNVTKNPGESGLPAHQFNLALQ